MPTPQPWNQSAVLLTGASQGIGRALALALAARNARVALLARTKANLDEVATECRAIGGDVEVVVADVTEPAQCERGVAQTLERFSRIDALINNAGISVVARFAALRDLALAERAMRVNYFGALYCTRAALPHLVESRGRIVAVASLTLRIELRSSGVSVTVAYPDFVQTEVRERVFGPSGERLAVQPPRGARFMTADECARRILAAAWGANVTWCCPPGGASGAGSSCWPLRSLTASRNAP
ncbi:MAG TPA: SDR family NAD(P)-dependent oxidoreductase [Gemmatimonadales bacterium]|jgi:short-subunit dehydrogenase